MPATIVLGVGAGIAAYKAALLARELIRAGHDVHVVPTPTSLEFVGLATWQALTRNPVHTGVFETGDADHVELARHADLVVIAPATADLIARIRAGRADDLLTTTVLACTCPVLLAPAMHTAMWTNAATRDNVAVLRERGMEIMDPECGALGSGDTGLGRLPEPSRIAEAALALLEAPPQDLAGRHILVTAGGTREPIDPVRYIGNISSGRQGAAIAAEALARGARVTLVAANMEPSLVPQGVEVVAAPSAQDMAREIFARLAGVDALVMSAAVADFRPAQVAAGKIKKDPDTTEAPTIVLERTVDILATASQAADRPTLVLGFAAETGTTQEVVRLGQDKARRKGADLLAVNRVGGGRGFGDVPNEVHLLDGRGTLVDHVAGSKKDVARALVNHMAARLGTIAR